MVTPVDIGGSIAKGLQVNQLRQQIAAQKAAEQEKNAMRSLMAERYGGLDPQSGIAWNTGRQAPAPQGGGFGSPGAVHDQVRPAMSNDQFAGRVGQISGDPQQVINWQQHFASMSKAELERDAAEAPFVVGAMRDVQDQAGYDRARAFLHNKGVDVSDFPPQYDRATTNLALQGYGMLAKMKPESYSPGSRVYDPITRQEIFSVPSAPGSTIGKLIADRDALPQGDSRRAYYDRAIAAESRGGAAGEGGPFGGTGMDAQSMNILLRGNPNSPEYLAAYNHYASPKMSYNSAGQLVTITPDMSAFRPPAGRGGVTQADAGGAAPQQAPGGGVTVQQAGPAPATKAQDAVDAAFAKDYAEFVAGGGFADAQKNIDQMRKAVEAIKAPGNMYGPVRGRLPDFVRNVTNPEAVNTREQIEEVVQRNLRVILGAQFTEKEGERLISRAFNPSLDDDINAGRLEGLLASMERGLQAKQAAAEYYEQHGTLNGYRGSALLTIQDLERAVEGGSGQQAPAGGSIGNGAGASLTASPDGRNVGSPNSPPTSLRTSAGTGPGGRPAMIERHNRGEDTFGRAPNDQQGQGGSAPSAYEGLEATNPETGEVLILRNGQWVPK